DEVPHIGARQGRLGQVLFDSPEIGAGEVEGPQMRGHGGLLVAGQRLLGQPGASLLANKIRGGGRRGGIGLRPRCRGFWFLSRVRWRTSCVRRATRRRSAAVVSSGIHTSGRKPPASSCPTPRGSDLSGSFLRS